MEYLRADQWADVKVCLWESIPAGYLADQLVVWLAALKAVV